ncbi:MAG: alpha-glucan family phosphorylase, partial [Armatimonadota bacterium]|nr:alpha-glucan family phosphorylase [Armatimonadota bacterium]
DRFPPDLVHSYFEHDYGGLGLSREEFLALGREDPANEQEPFNMAVLAIRLSSQSNAVSQLHSQVSRRMWQNLWPSLPSQDIPIGAVTNGVHLQSWLSHDMAQLFDRYLGMKWREDPTSADTWTKVENIPAEELWRTHERRRERLVAFVRQRLRQQLQRRGAPAREVEAAGEVLSPEALTIGFARRFATYKRAHLIFSDCERLARLLANRERPVQFIFAGKAHPDDQPGKELIRELHRFLGLPEFRGRMVFVEDYDMIIARYLLSGCDVWLNNPRRPNEASGTSGMKAAVNGVLNLSTLDGWWCEGYSPEVGWAIGHGEEYTDLEYQDRREANALYCALEADIVPLFYDRGADGIPRGWVRMMKNSIARIAPFFNTSRMVQEYSERYYLPGAQRVADLSANDFARARALAAWKERVRREWNRVAIVKVVAPEAEKLPLHSTVEVQALVQLGSLTPADVRVEIYGGRVDQSQQLANPDAVPIEAEGGPDASGHVSFRGTLRCDTSGRYGFTLRVLPYHPDLANPFEMGLCH